jgi:hypothetical protein
MALDARKRQKKAEQRKKKERKRNAVVHKAPQGWKERLERAAKSPVLHCLENGQQGMHRILLSRECSNGMIAFVNFLVDAWCLGVKDCFFGILPVRRYEEKLYTPMVHEQGLKPMRPEAARKFVEGAVEYARGLGLSPHSDYDIGRALFGDIDASASGEEFEYGVDGKPKYVTGPYDPVWRSRSIVDTLSRTCGEGNFHYAVHISRLDSALASRLGARDEFEDDEFDDDYEEDDFDEDDLNGDGDDRPQIVDVKVHAPQQALPAPE